MTENTLVPAPVLVYVAEVNGFPQINHGPVEPVRRRYDIDFCKHPRRMPILNLLACAHTKNLSMNSPRVLVHGTFVSII